MTAISYVKAKTPVDAERVDIGHIRAAVETLDETRAHLAALRDEEAELLAIIRAEIGSAQVGTIDGLDAVRLDQRTNTNLDRESVKTLLGAEAYGSVLRLTPYVTVNLVGKFKKSRR